MLILASIIAIVSASLMLSSKGMRNTYSLALLMIIDLLIFIGGMMVLQGDFWGIALVSLAGPFMMGFKVIQGANPRKVGIITFFGRRTSQVAEGLTLLCNWPLDIIGVSEHEIKLFNISMEIKSIRSYDGVRLEIPFSLSIKPDINKLDKWEDAGGDSGVTSILKGVVPSWIQQIITDEKCGWKWIEQHNKDLQRLLCKRLEGNMPTPAGTTGSFDDNSLINTEEMGFEIANVSMEPKVINPDVVKADEDIQIEELQREAEVADTKTINKQAQDRFDMYKKWAEDNPGIEIPTLAECRDQVMYERLAKDKKITIAQGGHKVNLSTTP